MSIRLQLLRDAWSFLSTFSGRAGEVVVDSTNNRLVVHDGTTPGGFPTLTAADLKVLQDVTSLGIGTTADAQNPFAAKLNKALWTALTTGEGGTGDLRYTLNKEAAGNVLSLLFQSGFSGRAELGLTGDDDLRLKVSPDGGTWREALRVDRATGGLDFAAAEAALPVAATVDLGAVAVLKVALTGSGTVTGFGTGPNRVRLLRFTAAATLTHNAASLALPGGANLVTAAGDTALATSDAAGNWTIRHYQRASGKPVTGPAAADITDSSASGRGVLTGTPAQGATALGLGTGSVPVFAGVGTSGQSFFNTATKQVLIGGGGDTGSEIKLTNFGSAHFSVYNVGGFFTVANTSSTNAGQTNLPGTPLLRIGTDGAAAFAAGAAFGGTVAIKTGSNPDSTGQVGGTFAATVYNATNNASAHGLLVKNNWANSASRILEVGVDLVGGAYLPALRVDGNRDTTVSGNVLVSNSLTFSGTRLGQHVNLFGATCGLGVQSNTVYLRTPTDFAVYQGGSHSPTQGDPGSGGTALLTISGGTAAFGGSVKPASYTVATLPTAGTAGRLAYATNGRASTGSGTVEAAGSGSGTLVVDSGTAWRVAGTNQTVQA